MTAYEQKALKTDEIKRRYE